MTRSSMPDLVKPREVEHDAQIYRAYRKESERIERKGGTNLRVQLDFELKSDVQKAIHAARKAEPERDMAEIKQQVAQQFDLPYVNDGIQIPTPGSSTTLTKGRSRYGPRFTFRPRGHRGPHRRLSPRPPPRQSAGWISCLCVGLRPRDLDRENRKRSPPDGKHFGVVSMTFDPLVALEFLGYTDREAAFLYLVAVHSGYFLRRQFDYFTDRNIGAIAIAFSKRRVRRTHRIPCSTMAGRGTSTIFARAHLSPGR